MTGLRVKKALHLEMNDLPCERSAFLCVSAETPIDPGQRNMDIPVGSIRGFEQMRRLRRVTYHHTCGRWGRT